MNSSNPTRSPLLSAQHFISIWDEYCQNDLPCPLTVTGNSMAPLLHHLQDTVLLRHPSRRPIRKGEILLCRRESGSLVLHRCKKITKDGKIHLCGDAHLQAETIDVQQVLAVAESIRRADGTILSCDNLPYRLWVALWLAAFPFRKSIFRLRNRMRAHHPSRSNHQGETLMKKTVYALQNGRLSAHIDSTGGELRSLKYNDTELIWQGDPAYWNQSAPWLFPFCGRVKDGVYTYEGTEYPMTIHGFLASSPMTATYHDSDRLTLTLTDSPETRKIYPFGFCLTITYRLTEDALNMEFTVKAGERALPFSFGGHPGFNLPISPDGFVGSALQFASNMPLTRLEITDVGLLGEHTESYPLSGNTLPLSPDPAGDCGIFFRIPKEQRSLTLESDALPCDISMDFGDFPVLGLWHAEGSPYLCIEPWQGLPAIDGIPTELITKPETILLPPHEAKQFTLSFRLTEKGD